jgi:methionyl-tRNA synthetase
VKAEDRSEFDSAIMTCIEALRIMAEVAYPIMPDTSQKLLESLGVSVKWSGYRTEPRVLQPGGHFAPPVLLFQRKE